MAAETETVAATQTLDLPETEGEPEIAAVVPESQGEPEIGADAKQAMPAAGPPLPPHEPAGRPAESATCSICALYPQKTRKMCVKCLATDTMVWRHLGSWPPTFDTSDKEEFLRSAAQERLENPRLEWKNLKCSLVEKMTRTRIKRHQQSYGGKYMPLECWLTQGFSEKHVLRSKKEFNADIDDWTYQVCIKECHEMDIREECATFLMEREMEVRKKKNKKGEKRSGENDWEVPDLEPSAAGPLHEAKKQKTDQGDAKASAKEAARAVREEQAAAKKAAAAQEAGQRLSRKLLATASKHVQGAESLVKRIDKAVEEAAGSLGETVCRGSLHYAACVTASKSLKDFLQEAQVIVQKVGRGEVLAESALNMENLAHLKAAPPALRGLQGEIAESRPEKAAPKRRGKRQEAANENADPAMKAWRRLVRVAVCLIYLGACFW